MLNTKQHCLEVAGLRDPQGVGEWTEEGLRLRVADYREMQESQRAAWGLNRIRIGLANLHASSGYFWRVCSALTFQSFLLKLKQPTNLSSRQTNPNFETQRSQAQKQTAHCMYQMSAARWLCARSTEFLEGSFLPLLLLTRLGV